MRYLIALLSLTVLLQAGHIESFAKKFGYETNYKSAIAKAKAENKAVMLVMVTHYCPWCRKFEAKTLSHQSIDDLLSKKYVKLILNRDKHQFPKTFETPLVPTITFIDPKKASAIKKIYGYKGREDFALILGNLPAYK